MTIKKNPKQYTGVYIYTSCESQPFAGSLLTRLKLDSFSNFFRLRLLVETYKMEEKQLLATAALVCAVDCAEKRSSRGYDAAECGRGPGYMDGDSKVPQKELSYDK